MRLTLWGKRGAINAGVLPPLVLHVGFAGSRYLYDASVQPTVNQDELAKLATETLREWLPKLLGMMGFPEGSIVCGVSQAAIGADTAFIHVCQDLDYPQRILLPQERSTYLTAVGSNGSPDFTAAERGEAETLLESRHIIEESVVANAPDRRARFEQVNMEIVRESDVLVCLVNKDAEKKRGGSLDAVAKATHRGIPVLQLEITFDSVGHAQIKGKCDGFPASQPPPVPSILRRMQASSDLSSLDTYTKALKTVASSTARRRQFLFKSSAFIVVGAHVLATILAVIALAFHPEAVGLSLAIGELALLMVGFGLHRWIHRSHAAAEWALARLVAEIVRSISALRGIRNPLRYLMDLPLPASLRLLVRTLNVLHLRDARNAPYKSWEKRCAKYRDERLWNLKSGQIPYYRLSLASANKRLRLAQRAFYGASSAAFLTVLLETIVTGGWTIELKPEVQHDAANVFGTMAIVLPVLAVAALSLAASFDVEARVATYSEMLEFLASNDDSLKSVTSEQEFISLALETERRLLGETVGWHSRRAFAVVT